MNNINTRKWSTPIIIASGLFVSISGILMFMGIHNPIGEAHEWIGLLFAAGIIAHILNHWRSFKNYFSQRMSLAIVGTIAIAGVGLIVTSLTQEGGSVMMSMIHSFEASPLTEVAPLLDQQVNTIIDRFVAAGYTVEGPETTISHIATVNEVEPKRLIHILFSK